MKRLVFISQKHFTVIVDCNESIYGDEILTFARTHFEKKWSQRAERVVVLYFCVRIRVPANSARLAAR